MIQSGYSDEDTILTQFPEDSPPPAFCENPVFYKTSVAILNGGNSAHPVNLQGEFVIDFEVLVGDARLVKHIQFDMFAYESGGGGSEDSLQRDAGISGLFYDPNTSGHGFNFNKGSAGLTIYYYGHTNTGERLWLISDTLKANLEYDTLIRLKMYELPQGVFGDPVRNVTEWGTLLLTINNCDSITADLSGIDGYFSADLVRLDDIEGVGCQ